MREGLLCILTDVTLCLAVVQGHRDVVHLLLTRGADVTAVNRAGKTAVDLARHNRYGEILKLIAEETFEAEKRRREGALGYHLNATTRSTAKMLFGE